MLPSIFLGMFSVAIMGNRDLLEPMMKMFNTIIVTVIFVTTVINLPKIIKAARA